MGRRKIEIQPITHERNRSVTFLKRKNGLFKKAYELGVLCSVDVAVIIFEERPGHEPKLYQYGSSTIHDIVQRQLRHNGEKDSRGPVDFSVNAPDTKMEDVGEQDDDEGEDDAEEVAAPARRRPKRDGDGKPKSTFGIPILPPPLPQQHPISSDRLRPPQNKKPRVGSSSAGGPQRTSRSSSEDTGYGYHPAPSFPYPQQHHSHHPPPQHQYQYAPQHQHSYPAQYPPFFQPPPSSHAHNDSPTTPQFIPLQSDFTFPPPRAHSPDRGGYGPRSIPSHRSNFTNGNGNGNGNSSSTGGSAGAGAGAGDLFAAFLDADEQRRRRSVPISPASAPGDSTRLGLDWPVHSAAAPAGAPPAAAAVSAERETAPGPGWLEFLSGSGDGRGAPGQGTGSGSGREAGGGGDGDGAKVESREVEIRASGESV